MANNLATLSSKLATALRDTDHAVWLSTEKDDLVTWAVTGLYPRFARGMDPDAAAGANTVTLVADDYFYAMPTGMVEVTSVDHVDANSLELGTAVGGGWSVVGDEWGTLKLRVSPRIVDRGGTLRLHGWGRYDVTTNLIPDHLVPMALAMARVEAYQRVLGEAARFEQYQAADPTQMASINQMIAMVESAEREVLKNRVTLKRSQRRPVPGRLG